MNLAIIPVEDAMMRFNRTYGMLAGACLALLLVVLATVWSLGAPVRPVSAAPVENLSAQLQAPKPVEGWYVCRNLGIGAVPGVPDPRQRLKLCHDSGWEVYAYCTQVGLPVPPVGRRCTRISGDTYQCGARNQRVREYRILETPVETATAMATSTQAISTSTATPTTTQPVFAPTATQGHRVPTGGTGNAQQVQSLIVIEAIILLLAAIVGAFIVWRVAKSR
jgi:hypothetical protein